MVRVIGVRFRRAGKVYFFDPAGLDIKKDDIVDVIKGIEFFDLTFVLNSSIVSTSKIPLTSSKYFLEFLLQVIIYR